MLDVLIPIRDRPGALAVTLTGLAAHAGEDVVAQLRVMERYGGAGLLPSRAYHLELPTTMPDRDAECYDHVIADAGVGKPR